MHRHTRADGAAPGFAMRLDSGPVQQPYWLADGTLALPAYLSRSGVLQYSYDDGTTGGEYRDPAELFSEYTRRSFQGVALTIGHPSTPVTTDNRAALAKGFIGFDVTKDGIFLASTIYITDRETIEGVASGKYSELSCGYSCGIETVGGTDPETGAAYDCKQVGIYGNHVALVERARAGAEVKIYLPSY